MRKIEYKELLKRTPKESRHMRFNVEQSRTELDEASNPLALYHVVQIEQGSLGSSWAVQEEIFNYLRKQGGPPEILRQIEGKVGNSKYKLLYTAFHSPRNINLKSHKLEVIVRFQDTQLRENISGGPEAHIEDTYNLKETKRII